VKIVLTVIAGAIFAGMLAATITTSVTESLWSAWPAYAASPWAMATLYDAYSGFTLFWLWVAYRERTWAVRIVWLLLIFALGNIATSLYVLLALWRLPQGEPVQNILQRRSA
jgi:hypothetical protein